MVVELFSDGDVLKHFHINNKLSMNGNVLLGKNGSLRVDVPIISTGDTPQVRLYVRGLASGSSATEMIHGVSGHDHGDIQIKVDNVSRAGFQTSDSGAVGSFHIPASGNYLQVNGENTDQTNIGLDDYSTSIPFAAVPQAIQIWIDGTEYTVTIGDPNTKGGTMYDGTNDDWGIDGTTEWDTGELDLSGLITWTQGEHYVELKETGGTGGVLVYTLLIN